MLINTQIFRRIWLIGGTQESGYIAKAIANLMLPCTVTVTTPTAITLYPKIEYIKVIICQLKQDKLKEFLRTEQIGVIVDASHPYAVEVSQMAIATAKDYNIPYLRYERPNVSDSPEKVIELESFGTLLEGDYLLNQRVLLTVGYKVLPLFQAWQTRSRLYARILPVVNSLEVALSAGFTPDRLIALRPPFSFELERALWQHWGITLVVTKASGKAGGEDIKRGVASQLKIPLIVITRPEMVYPQQTHDLTEVITFCRQQLERI
ncbi:precorrin-6x reductase [Gloeothece citriformis PCC 7424]|uniref:Precorrin-6x reductase n=1 Tax=Gloeothece citriformis (strain PCC 7424) TaxID=65393 RepID=B7KDG6_GLOC7|nr:cobalt-precorrin-6A reductase [Gloeothece citriformis]ACK68986.1 precorrin-6x reductase [Gloeothece citriformis PCC 7424]